MGAAVLALSRPAHVLHTVIITYAVPVVKCRFQELLLDISARAVYTPRHEQKYPPPQNVTRDVVRGLDRDLESRAARTFHAPERERHDLRADRREVSYHAASRRRGHQAAEVALDKIGGVNILTSKRAADYPSITMKSAKRYGQKSPLRIWFCG